MTAVTNFNTLGDLKQKFILFTGLETRNPKFNKSLSGDSRRKSIPVSSSFW